MSIGGAIVSFVIIWWLVLFVTLPIRPRSVWEEPDKHPKGADQGAPVDPAIWFKLKLTTGITIPVWLGLVILVSVGILSPV